MNCFKLLPILFLGFFSISSQAQLATIDHWETVVFETDTWHYFLGFSAPPTNWKEPSFSPSAWQTGPGGIGYADGDDNTIIPSTLSLYQRLDFNIVDSTNIVAAILHADYDDAFVAYLNGHEIARANIGTVGTPPSYTDTAYIYREAVMYQGQNPSSFLILKDSLFQYLKQGSNTLAIQVHNHSATSSDMSSRFFLSVAINDTSTTYQPTPSWFFTPFVATNLPLLKINTHGQEIPQEDKIMADMQIIDNDSLNYLDDIPNGYDGKIGIEIRGASSTIFEKKGFGIETRDSLGNNNNVPLLGLPSENDWTLHGPYADKSLLRNVITYHIGSQLGRYNPRVRMCEVFINDQYWGVYVLIEKIKRDKNRVDIAKLTPADTLGDELTGGYIFKIDRDIGPDDGWYSPYGYGYYNYHHPNADDLHQKQKDYIKNHFLAFENMMASPSYANLTTGYHAWIDVPSFIDYMLMQEITRNIDAYRLSAFMYKDKDSNDGKIYAGPIWDFNLGFGNEDFCDNGSHIGWAFQYNQACGAPFPYWWGRLVSDFRFKDAFNCRWQELRSTVLHTDTIHHFIDSMVVELSGAQARNFERWDILGVYVWPNPYISQTYPQEITYVKNWITQRLNWMDNNMIGNPNNCLTSTDTPLQEDAVAVYPNPFHNEVTFELKVPKSLTIQVYDVLGKTVATIQVDSHDSFYRLSTDQWADGVYFYGIFSDGQLIDNGKIMKN